MRKHLLLAGFAALTLIPSLAVAETNCETHRGNRVAGTVVGGGIGALLGSAIAGRGDRTAGAVIGGIGGAVLGNQISKPKADCAHAYGYYDKAGNWHANAVDRADAQGYFDRDGNWIDGTPNGHYDRNGRWVAASASEASGYYDAQGHWVPASASAYYGPDERWTPGAASGHYDSNGRWIPGPTTGRYDRDGRWSEGAQSGRRDADGRWISDPQPGYYDENGRWHVGQVAGYYDARGRWTSTDSIAYNQQQYRDDDRLSLWRGAPQSLNRREAWLEQRIQNARANRRLTRSEADRAMRAVSDIRRDERDTRRRHGRLTERDVNRLQTNLDAVFRNVQLDIRNSGARG